MGRTIVAQYNVRAPQTTAVVKLICTFSYCSYAIQLALHYYLSNTRGKCCIAHIDTVSVKKSSWDTSEWREANIWLLSYHKLGIVYCLFLQYDEYDAI